MSDMESIIREFCEPLPGIVAVYLFGSHAKGRATAASDVDIAILFEHRKIPDGQAILDLQEALAGRLHVSSVDLVVMNNINPIMKYQIFRHGRIVLKKDMKQLNSFRVRSLTDYADVKRMRAPIERAILKGRIHG